MAQALEHKLSRTRALNQRRWRGKCKQKLCFGFPAWNLSEAVTAVASRQVSGVYSKCSSIRSFHLDRLTFKSSCDRRTYSASLSIWHSNGYGPEKWGLSCCSWRSCGVPKLAAKRCQFTEISGSGDLIEHVFSLRFSFFFISSCL